MEKRNPLKIYENENQAIVNLSDGKIPPQALDLEEAVLGAMLIDEKGVNEVIDILSPEVFYKKSHQLIFESIQRLFRESEPIDLLTVSADLKKNKNLINFSNLRIGKYGLEKFFDNMLRGEFGRRREEVNARGKIITSNLYEKPNAGKNLNLSIDLNIQSYALTRLQNINSKMSELNEPETGSVVVMDVDTGELICCVSSPNFNPNIFTRDVKSKELLSRQEVMVGDVVEVIIPKNWYTNFADKFYQKKIFI